MKENSVQAKNQLEINKTSAHDFNVSTIQLEIKNSAQDINTRNNRLKIKEKVLMTLTLQTINQKQKETVRKTLTKQTVKQKSKNSAEDTNETHS